MITKQLLEDFKTYYIRDYEHVGLCGAVSHYTIRARIEIELIDYLKEKREEELKTRIVTVYWWDNYSRIPRIAFLNKLIENFKD